MSDLDIEALRLEAASEVVDELDTARSNGDDYCVDGLPINLAAVTEVDDE